jgi:hypothetical protein
MNGRPHVDIERLVRDVQQFEQYEDRETRWRHRWLLIWAFAICGACLAGYCLYRAYEAWPA